MFVVVAPTLPATQIKMKSPGLLVPALQELLAGTKTVPRKDDMVSQEPNAVPNHIKYLWYFTYSASRYTAK